jgi:hypothetical protein
LFSPAPYLDTKERVTLILNHLKALRKVKFFLKSKIMVAIENNLGMSGSDIEADIKSGNIHDVHVIREEKKTKPGFVTTEARKLEYEEIAKHTLEHGQLRIFDGAISGNTFILPADEAVPRALKLLETQMRQMRHLESIPDRMSSKTRVVVSGKFDSNGNFANTNDDLCLTLMMCMYWFAKWRRHSLHGGVEIRNISPHNKTTPYAQYSLAKRR